ncbi:CPBP family intramembrane metalloprotease [Stieleria sp. TO1_6]|uniref:CPBP family glutamic-type intramembrane protease n=1 Tax=Stieleria tagensis TaxID=2956795 RepID=UPI00209A9E82|nr:CPBP family intramembrane glutamic endopeptidase [Stieleria tagensis]MCO8122459.1 CPBP family intramembrane metalloprotease [Stieleria tagensis]
MTVPARPRIWTALLLPLVSLASFLATSFVMSFVAVFVVHGKINGPMMLDPETMRTVSASRLGLILLVIVPQFALVFPALLAAFLSPVPTLQRLSLVRGHWPLWAWLAAAVTTPLVGWASSILIGSLLEQSENLKMMTNVFRGHGESGFLIPLALLIGTTPAICEELLFRGYVQTRLTRALSPASGILISSLLFALFHLDWIHIMAVFPLGVYLGFITWRSGSILPAMLGHFFNNAISVVAVVLAPEDPNQQVSPEMAMFLSLVLLTGLIGSVWTAVAIWRIPRGNSAASVMDG